MRPSSRLIRTVRRSPGKLSSNASAQLARPVTRRPCTSVTRSPTRRPPRHAGPSSKTRLAINQPWFDTVSCTPDQPGSTVSPRIRKGSEPSTSSTGMAKPIASARESTIVLTPTTRPSASNSGPPELPGLIAASV